MKAMDDVKQTGPRAVLGSQRVPEQFVREYLMLRPMPVVAAANRGRSMPPGFQCLHPGGMRENSPAIYRWVNECGAIPSPGGTEELVSRHSFAPFGASRVRDISIPAINRWAIFGRPCGAETAPVASNPSGIDPGWFAVRSL